LSATLPSSPHQCGQQGRSEEREQLERWARRRKSAQALALRSRIVLGCADGLPNKGVAAREGWRSTRSGNDVRGFLNLRPDGLGDDLRDRAFVPRTPAAHALNAPTQTVSQLGRNSGSVIAPRWVSGRATVGSGSSGRTAQEGKPASSPLRACPPLASGAGTPRFVSAGMHVNISGCPGSTASVEHSGLRRNLRCRVSWPGASLSLWRCWTVPPSWKRHLVRWCCGRRCRCRTKNTSNRRCRSPPWWAGSPGSSGVDADKRAGAGHRRIVGLTGSQFCTVR
jgi:hypothetical protein